MIAWDGITVQLHNSIKDRHFPQELWIQKVIRVSAFLKRIGGHAAFLTIRGIESRLMEKTVWLAHMFWVVLCKAGPLCTCSVVWWSAWETLKNHRDHEKNREGGGRQTGRVPDNLTLVVFQKVAVLEMF